MHVKDIKISAEFDWIVINAIQSKLDGWKKITDEDCEGYTHMKANRDFIIECCEKVLAEIDAQKWVPSYKRTDSETTDIMDAKRDLVEANGGWADVSDAVVVKVGD
jgi:hypothetical protein